MILILLLDFSRLTGVSCLEKNEAIYAYLTFVIGFSMLLVKININLLKIYAKK